MRFFPVLSLQIWLPIIGAFMIVLFGKSAHHPQRAKSIALLFTLISLILCIWTYQNFDFESPAMQFKEFVPWLSEYGIAAYALGIDGMALSLIILSTITTLVVILATWNSITEHVHQYMMAFLVMQGLMVGVFSATNAMLFYVFWEATLIPMYIIIGIWGSDNRSYASIKFFLYTFFGSILMLLGLIYLGLTAGDFSIAHFYTIPLSMTAQILLFIGFFLAFAIKIPMWPVHTWLPDAHTEAPAGGSVVLAAVMLKMGAYGFLRFSLPIVPDASLYFSTTMIALSLIAIVYIGYVAIVQTDVKKLIAYSSISHMGFVTLGCFMLYPIVANTGNAGDAALGVEGALMVTISHGFISGALFLGIGYLYDRLHTRDIAEFGGIAKSMPVFAAFFMLFAMANAGLPGTSGFVGEFMVIVNAMSANFWICAICALTLILGASYTLWMYKRVFLGPVVKDHIRTLDDIQGMELWAFMILGALVLLVGVYPQILLEMFHQSISQILTLATTSKLPAATAAGYF